ncbi:MAG: 50S ribosomal protein L29 [Oscillospiraceae bacterium]|nr:50S ribosomal protein L29 [Oscillospiraceae bacterium]
MKVQQFRDMSQAEVVRKLNELKKDLFNLRMQHATNQLDNPMVIAQVRKDIARAQTVLREIDMKEAAGK